jgi:hypothetical protein
MGKLLLGRYEAREDSCAPFESGLCPVNKSGSDALTRWISRANTASDCLLLVTLCPSLACAKGSRVNTAKISSSTITKLAFNVALANEDCAKSFELVVQLRRGTMGFTGRLSRMT